MKTGTGSAAALAQIATLGDLFAWRVRQTPEREAYRQFDFMTGDWVSHTWAQMADRVGKWRNALNRLQLFHEARVAILLPNGGKSVV